MTTSRVDIGVFASNGVHDSAPAILSWYFPPTEKRRTEPGPDGALRIAAIDHANPGRAYADPILVPRADWRDDFAYDAAGTLLGWTRVRGDQPDARPPNPSTPKAGACPTRRTPPPPSRSSIRCRGPRTAGSWSRRSMPPPSEAGSACCDAACSHPPGGTL